MYVYATQLQTLGSTPPASVNSECALPEQRVHRVLPTSCQQGGCALPVLQTLLAGVAVAPRHHFPTSQPCPAPSRPSPPTRTLWDHHSHSTCMTGCCLKRGCTSLKRLPTPTTTPNPHNTHTQAHADSLPSLILGLNRSLG